MDASGQQRRRNRKAEREIASATARILRCGPQHRQMEQVLKAYLQALGKRCIKQNVLALAKQEAVQMGITVDRGACRRFSCTICWFCEHKPGLLVQQPVVDDLPYDWDFQFEQFEEWGDHPENW
jgi:hypothetical protein